MMISDKEMRIIIRVIGVFTLLVSFVFAVMFSIGSGSSILISVLAWAGLFSLISGIGLLFLKNWARIYSGIYLSVATVHYLSVMLKEYSETKFIPSLVLAIILSLVSLALVIFLFSPKVNEQFKQCGAGSSGGGRNNEKKRSVGVTVLGVLIIVFSSLALLSYKNPKQFLYFYIKPFGIIFYILGISASLFEIILGINIFKLKEWSRRYLLRLMAVFICWMFVLPLVEDKNNVRLAETKFLQSQKQYITQESKDQIDAAKRKFEEAIKGYSIEWQEKAKGIYKIFDMTDENAQRNFYRVVDFLLSRVLYLCWYLLVIFFFTRPKVKEQFKQDEIKKSF